MSDDRDDMVETSAVSAMSVLGDLDVSGTSVDNLRPMAMSTRFYLALLGWASSHLDVVRKIGPQLKLVRDADTYVQRWEAVKPIGDVIAPALDDFPVLASDATSHYVDATTLGRAEERLAETLAVPVERLTAIMAALVKYLPLILQLLGAMKTRAQESVGE